MSVADASGSGNAGTVTNTVWTAGKYGKALSFNGTGSRVTVADSASLRLASAMTLEAWVYPTTVSSAWRDLIMKGNDNYYLAATTTSGGRPGGGGIFGGSYGEAFGTAPMPTNTWAYLALSYDGATVRFYVNGAQVASRAKTGTIRTSTNALTIGSDPFYGQYFRGMIDEVRVYNTALTVAQIQADMATPITDGGVDTQAPSAPGTLSATAVSSGRVDLGWGAATDDTAVTGYRIERCQGAGCTSFSQIAAPTGTATSYSDTTAAADTSYSYRVRATDAATNLGPYSNTATATTPTDTQPPSRASDTPGSDDFNRADGGLGASWAAMGDGGLSISSQAVVGSSGAHAGDIRVGEVYGADQWSQVEVTAAQLGGGQWIGPVVRAQNGGQDTYLGIYFWNSGSPVLRLYKRSAGTWIQLGSSYNSGPLAAGTRLKLVAVGSRISFLQDGVERIVVSDTSLGGGAPGVMAYGAAKADNWSAGNAVSTGTFSVGGTVSGLSGTVVLQNNGGDDLSVAGNGPFAFASLLAGGAAYNVTVKTSPAGQTCTVAGGSGTVASTNVTSVTVTCTGGTTGAQIVYRSTDANGVASYDVTSVNNGYGTQVLRVLAPTNPAPGVAHNFLYALPVEAGLGSVYGDGLETLRALNAQNQYNLTIVEPSFAIEPWYADNPNDPNLRYETFMTNDLVPWVEQSLASTGNEQNWLIGFSKSGIGAADLILKHPGLFTLAASWDFPADMAAYDDFGASSANSYGTDASFQANYRLTPAFVAAHKAPFQTDNRIWIGGYSNSAPFQDDMSDYDALLTSVGIVHTTGTPQPMSHRWDSGWVPIALAALSQDAGALGAQKVVR